MQAPDTQPKIEHKDYRCLCDVDQQLYQHFSGKSDDYINFNQKTLADKKSFLIKLMSDFRSLVDHGKIDTMDDIDRTDIISCGSYYHAFCEAYKIYSQPTHEMFFQWNCDIGDVKAYFENFDGVIYVSYFSDCHKQKHFRHLWEFGKEDYHKYAEQLKQLPKDADAKPTEIMDSLRNNGLIYDHKKD